MAPSDAPASHACQSWTVSAFFISRRKCCRQRALWVSIVVLLAISLAPSVICEYDSFPYDGYADESGMGGGFSVEELGGIEDGIGPGEDFGDYAEKYEGVETEDLEKEYGSTDSAVEEYPSPADPLDGVLELDDELMEKFNDGNRKMLVEFYAVWDKACSEKLPMMVDIGKAFEDDPEVLIGKIDADRHWKLAAKYDATSYPHFVLFDKDDPLGEVYQGEVTAQHLISLVKEGTKSGVVPELKPVVAQFMRNKDARSDGVTRLEQALERLEENEKEHGGYYKKVMLAILEKGEDFVAKEAERISKLMAGGSLPSGKFLTFRKRLNVLKSFSEHNEL